MWIDSLRTVVCVGPGGVGKTTVASALAGAAAIEGRNVLCLTVDPAKRLAQTLGLTEGHHAPERIPTDRWLAPGVEARGSLWGMALNTKTTFDELIARYAPSPQVRDRIFGNRVYQALASSIAGTQEYLALEKLHELNADPRFDLIVLDTPPTSNALDFLEAPERLVQTLDSPTLRWLADSLRETQGKRTLLSRGTHFILQILSRFTGSGFLNDVAHFSADVGEIFIGFRARADRVMQSLRAPSTAFVVIAAARQTSLAESVYFSRQLTQRGLRPRGVIVNRVRLLTSDTLGADAQIAEALRRVARDPREAERVLSSTRKCITDHVAAAQSEQALIERTLEPLGQDAFRARVPELVEDAGSLRELAHVGWRILQAAAP